MHDYKNISPVTGAEDTFGSRGGCLRSTEALSRELPLVLVTKLNDSFFFWHIIFKITKSNK